MSHMLRPKHLVAAAILVAGIAAMTNLAEAQDYVLAAPDCVSPPPSLAWYKIYYPDNFVADWGPFFRRHDYRYGPILPCAAVTVIATPPVISSKY